MNLPAIDSTRLALLRRRLETERVRIVPATILGRETVQYAQPDGRYLNDPADNDHIRNHYNNHEV